MDLSRVVDLRDRDLSSAEAVHSVYVSSCAENLSSIVEMCAEPLASPAVQGLLKRSLVPDFREGVHEVVLAEPASVGVRRLVCQIFPCLTRNQDPEVFSLINDVAAGWNIVEMGVRSLPGSLIEVWLQEESEEAASHIQVGDKVCLACTSHAMEKLNR